MKEVLDFLYNPKVGYSASEVECENYFCFFSFNDFNEILNGITLKGNLEISITRLRNSEKKNKIAYSLTRLSLLLDFCKSCLANYKEEESTKEIIGEFFHNMESKLDTITKQLDFLNFKTTKPHASKRCDFLNDEIFRVHFCYFLNRLIEKLNGSTVITLVRKGRKCSFLKKGDKKKENLFRRCV